MAVYVMLVSELMKNKSFDSEHYKSPKADIARNIGQDGGNACALEAY